MFPEFRPLFHNPHVLTIAGNFWPRHIDTARFPAKKKIYRIYDDTRIVVFEHQPQQPSVGQIVFVHGLEGSAHAGYIQSLAQDALSRGYSVHRTNLRSCGGTEDLCKTMYHSGLTEDTHHILNQLASSGLGPTFVVGFSLGGNVILKLLGELGCTNLVVGGCAISTPIDLAACVRLLDKPSNYLYASRFLDRLKARIRRKSKLTPDLYTSDGLAQIKTIWDFDDHFTAPLFGFGTAANYYQTQSAIQYLSEVRTPCLVISSKDDPLVPIESYHQHVAFRNNPALRLLITEQGGHLGFISRRKPRFWLDGVVLNWIDDTRAKVIREGTNSTSVASA